MEKRKANNKDREKKKQTRKAIQRTQSYPIVHTGISSAWYEMCPSVNFYSGMVEETIKVQGHSGGDAEVRPVGLVARDEEKREGEMRGDNNNFMRK